MSGRVDGETAVITGAAQGIGKAIARRLGAEGAAVVIADRQAEKAAGVAEDLRAEGAEAEAVDCDVTDREDTVQMVDRAAERFGGVDILVNNAGIGSAGSVEDIDPDAWDLVLDVNLTGPYNCCRAVVPGMIERGHGRIVNISSMAGRNISYHGAANYTASKWGLVGLTKHMAWDLGEHGITVNAVCPGATETELTREGTTEAERAETTEKVPLGRWADPEDQAEAVLYFAADSGEFTTGTVLEVDGGQQLAQRHEI
ncbi:MAG: NAD(P)-dependent dehydrogenase (short-subunit alcohol dehydrogenase family) [Natronomonas sp.]|jgi:NAD(P)-dependent dehydrogenase (short-subunit alcohol dehydrogenase family)